MKKKIHLVSLLLVLLISPSCEHWIDVDLPDDQINTAAVFQDAQTVNAALMNLYINFRNQSPYSGSEVGLGTILGLYTDELENLTPSSSPMGYYALYHNQLNPTSSSVATIWTNSYTHIYAINAFIEGLTASTAIPNQDKEIPLAEALLLRVLYYQALTQVFGAIPYVTSTDYKINTTLGKTNSQEILQALETDLLAIEPKLSDAYRTPTKFYPNKAVVDLVLAKNYLLQKQYNQAEKQAQIVIQSPLYAIEKDVNQVFKQDAKSTLWQLSNDSNTDAPTLEAINYIILTSSSYQVSEQLLHCYDTLDQRRKNWINTITLNDTPLYYAYKYKNRTANPDENSVIFRLEEAYFIRAEALIYQHQLDQAIPLLNTIRNRAGLANLPDTLTEEQLLTALLDESQREFFTEHGRRFFDLKRNDRLSQLQQTKPNWQSIHALWPYPEKETLLNPNLLPQNYGY